MNDIDAKKKEILKGLVKSDQDNISRLRDQVEKSKELFWIEESTGKIIPIRKRHFNLQENILIQLIGKYFAMQLEIAKNNVVSIEDLTNACRVSSRALSRPIGVLLKNHIIEKKKEGYVIKPYQVDEAIDILSEEKPFKIPEIQTIKSKRKKQKIAISKQKKEKPFKKLNKEGVKKLLDKLGVDEEILHYIFDFDENEVRIITGIEGKNEREKQLNATLLYLTVYKYCFDLKEISSSDLREKIEELGIKKSLVNLSTNLKKCPNFISHKRRGRGRGGSTDTSYKITIPGELKGIKLISKICKSINN